MGTLNYNFSVNLELQISQKTKNKGAIPIPRFKTKEWTQKSAFEIRNPASEAGGLRHSDHTEKHKFRLTPALIFFFIAVNNIK